MCYNATYLRSWDYFCFLTKKKLKKSGYKKSAVFFFYDAFVLVNGQRSTVLSHNNFLHFQSEWF